ncbi:hypothetical protein [Janibacter sp. GS2]|uniref:hypothetical protein n=1 Tax=Janibacter sp. GS2 TaxID=3442646 RepID=UPI003EC0F485
MSDATATSLRTRLRRLSSVQVLAVQIVLAVVTVLLSWTSGWQATVVGLALMHVFTALVTLGPWGSRRIPHPAPPAPASKAQLTRLSQRVDELGDRVASTAHLTHLGQQVDELGERVASTAHLTRLEEQIAALDERVTSTAQLTRLEQRVDGLGARLVAGSERTRAEVLDALASSRGASGDQSS